MPDRRPTTLGELKASGYRPRSVKQEMRDNLRARSRAGEPLFPGILGYDRTVIPGVVNALLAGHDFILLGLRGQAKTRILRALVTAARRGDPGPRRQRAQRRPAGADLDPRPAPASPRPATTRPSSGWPREAALQREARDARTSRSPTCSATSTRSRRRPASSPSPTPRSSTSASSRAPTAASSPSTSCPTSRRASRSACSTSSRSATSRSAASRCASRSTS